MVVRDDYPTPLSSIYVKPNGERSVVNYRHPQAHLSKNHIDRYKFKPKVMLFDGHEAEISLVLLKEAREKGIKTVLDAGSLHKGTKAIYKEVDYLVCSQKFALQATGESDSESAIEKLYNDHKNIVITLGKDGLIWKNQEGEDRFPAFSVKVLDTTGAGDVFHGAFATCLALNKSWVDTLKYSSAAAAIFCTKPGGREGIPNLLEIEFFLKTQ